MKRADGHKRCTRAVYYMRNTCNSSATQLTAVHCAPGLGSATKLGGVLYCTFCALCKRLVYRDYSA